MKNTLHDLFKTLEQDFDIETPQEDHQARFLNKLNAQDKTVINLTRSKKTIWKPVLAIAASLVLMVSIFIGIQNQNTSRELASVSPKMAETQDFFTATINEELKKLKSESSPETQKLIQDALTQINILEKNYETLKDDLVESGDDNRVIYAMISNFQNRIDILQYTLDRINIIKQSKNDSHENIL